MIAHITRWRTLRPYQRGRLYLWLRDRWIALTGTYTCDYCGLAGLPLHADDLHHCERDSYREIMTRNYRRRVSACGVYEEID